VAPSRFDRERVRLAGAVRRRRLQLGLSQEEAAHKIGIATRHFQKLEAAEVNITLRTLVAVAEGLATTIGDLFA
jgi:transcriptional regulator with XRE-family HTH domain